ncbi:MAG: hypothetical protein ACOYL3_15685 [Desulfuromonadaceae bacterium]
MTQRMVSTIDSTRHQLMAVLYAPDSALDGRTIGYCKLRYKCFTQNIDELEVDSMIKDLVKCIVMVLFGCCASVSFFYYFGTKPDIYLAIYLGVFGGVFLMYEPIAIIIEMICSELGFETKITLIRLLFFLMSLILFLIIGLYTGKINLEKIKFVW